MIVFILLGIRPQMWQPEAQRRVRRGLIGFVLLVLVIAIPLGVIMGGIVRDTATQQAIQRVLEEHTVVREEELIAFEYRTEPEGLVVVATMRSSHPLDQTSVDAIAAALSEHLDQPVRLEMVTLPVIRSKDQ